VEARGEAGWPARSVESRVVIATWRIAEIARIAEEFVRVGRHVIHGALVRSGFGELMVGSVRPDQLCL
jgi:hypothetical protein